MTVRNNITLSVVSHGQASLIHLLLSDLALLPRKNFDVIVTINLPEDEAPYQGFTFPLKIIRNDTPKGFGSNHNAAFHQTSSSFFAVVNPDIRINSLEFDELLSSFECKTVGAVAPVVISSEGQIEDSARRFPTLFRFASRVFLGARNADYTVQSESYLVDWVAGMFVVFRREAFIEVFGFDDRRFFMYLEDADICYRLGKMGWQVIVNPNFRVVHVAQRASRHNLTHMRWHVTSAIRFLTGL